MTEFSLSFGSLDQPELFSTVFCHSLLGAPQVAIRGGGGSTDSFRWSAGVHSLSILMVRSLVWGELAKFHAGSMAALVGGRGSPALSLDYAISKKPAWLSQMFGSDLNGDPLLRRLLHRINPELKRPGPVVIYLNTQALHPHNIRVLIRGSFIDDRTILMELLSRLEESWGPHQDRDAFDASAIAA